ncbi:hypothetical protein [Carnobacterium maltaromaticum]|uniref:hypothetical protein n=1 Tax=Carnobacterium maltaromaticum TaxID=2751 RepID=UPI00295E438B|nr:hypothetical protein [Carnobacterium maltaromaticum]
MEVSNIQWNNCEWIGTSVTIEVTEVEKNQLVTLLDLDGESYSYEKSRLEIHKKNNLLFLEKYFIDSLDLEFEDLLKKYNDKDLSSLKYFSQNDLKIYELSDKISNEKIIFKEIFDSNNIITNGIVEGKLVIPPSLFNELKEMYLEYDNEDVDSLNYLTELFSLLAIADKSKIYIEEDKTYIEFTVFCENKENHVLKVLWKDWNFFKNNVYYKCLQWIILRKEESFKLSTIVTVVRQYLGTLGNIEDVEDLTSSLDSILNRIILNETKEYFTQQNRLKDEFITYKKMELDSKKTLMKSLLGLITTISLAYYGKIISITNFEFTKKNESLAIIFIFGILAIVFFIFTFVINFTERKKYYISLKKIYINKFAFSEKDFESYLKKPTLKEGYLIYWITLTIFTLVIIFFISMYLGWIFN